MGASYPRHNSAVGRVRGLALACLAALAFASAAQAKPLLGITGDLPRFQTLTGQASTVHQAFLGWGQGASYGSSFTTLFGTLTPIPMITLNTGLGSSRKEAVTPAQIAAGKGDGYLFSLNQAIAQWNQGIYVRPLAEMNNYAVLWSGYTKGGKLKAGHTPADYRRAFARIYLIVHGGPAATIDAKLKALHEPPIAHDLASNPFPRVRVVWSPLAGANPRVAGNAAENYYPGKQYVDVDGGDIYDERLTDTAPWNGLEDLYQASIGHGRPFAVPEWGLSLDDPTYIKHMCTFLSTHTRTEEAGFYESRPGSVWDIEPKPQSRALYRTCIVLLGAPLPAWAKAGGTPAAAGAGVTFTAGGKPLGSAVEAPIGADELEVNIAPATGVIGSAFWIRNGHALGRISVPSGATGLAFESTSGGAAPTPIVRPHAGTGFHVKWTSSGTIASAWWMRVSTKLADIPVAAGQTSIAFTQGP